LSIPTIAPLLRQGIPGGIYSAQTAIDGQHTCRYPVFLGFSGIYGDLYALLNPEQIAWRN